MQFSISLSLLFLLWGSAGVSRFREKGKGEVLTRAVMRRGIVRVQLLDIPSNRITQPLRASLVGPLGRRKPTITSRTLSRRGVQIFCSQLIRHAMLLN